MRNWGWATKDDADPVIPVVKPVLSALIALAGSDEFEATINDDDTLEIDLGGIEAGIDVKLSAFTTDVPADIYFVDPDSEAIGSKINIGDTLFTSDVPSTTFKFLVVKKNKPVTDIDDGTL